MAKFRFSLRVTITTRQIVVEADSKDEVRKLVEIASIEEIVKNHSDTLEIQYLTDVVRITEGNTPTLNLKPVALLEEKPIDLEKPRE